MFNVTIINRHDCNNIKVSKVTCPDYDAVLDYIEQSFKGIDKRVKEKFYDVTISRA